MDSCYKTPDFSRRAAKRGFTLIELSIVLIIIGIITGGILVGRDLIHAAEIRATIKQLEDFNTAANTFKVKYNCLPGDCPHIEKFGFAAGSNGTGNGVIAWMGESCATSIDPDCGQKEHTNFWYHLSAAGLISFAGRDYYDYCPLPCNLGSIEYRTANTAGIVTPPTKIRPIAFPTTPSGIVLPGGWSVTGRKIRFDVTIGGGEFSPHSFILGSVLSSGGVVHNSGAQFNNQILMGYAPADIHAIDVKIDDGLPFAGGARAASREAGNNPWQMDLNNNLRSPAATNVPPNAYCVDNVSSPALYNVTYPGNPGAMSLTIAGGKRAAGNCSLVIKAAF